MWWKEVECSSLNKNDKHKEEEDDKIYVKSYEIAKEDDWDDNSDDDEEDEQAFAQRRTDL